MSATSDPPISRTGARSWDRVLSARGTLTRAEFEGLPLVDRVRLLSSGELRFFSGTQEVTPGRAFAG